MSYYKCYITRMARGESGRIVIEVEPEVKRRLYAALALSGSTLKDWFIRNAASFCNDSAQPSLSGQPGHDEGNSFVASSVATDLRTTALQKKKGKPE